MTITEKVAYLKGLAEGMKVDGSTNEGKLMMAVIDTLEDLALTVEDLDDGLGELSSQVDEIDEDLGSLEEEIYGDDEDEDDCDCGCEDDELYDVECPNCGDEICIDETMLEEGSMQCPNCGELLEFEVEEDEDCCCGCDDCDHTEE